MSVLESSNDLSKAPSSCVPSYDHAAFTNGRGSYFWLVRFHFLESISEQRKKKLRKGECHLIIHTGFLRVLLKKKKKSSLNLFLQKLQWKSPWRKFLSWFIYVSFPENVEQVGDGKENGFFEISLKVRHFFFSFSKCDTYHTCIITLHDVEKFFLQATAKLINVDPKICFKISWLNS